MYKVLIVDDEKIIVNGLRKMIDWCYYDMEVVDTITNPNEAIEYIDSDSIDILITDINMPEITGVDLLKRVKEKCCKIRCVVLSGYDDFEYVRNAFLYGAVNYILKPVDEDKLIDILVDIKKELDKERIEEVVRENKNRAWKNIQLQKLLLGTIKKEELDRQEVKENINEDMKYYTVAVIKFSGLNNIQLGQRLWAYFRDPKNIRSKYEGTELYIESIMMESSTLAIIWGWNTQDSKNIISSLQDWIRRCVAMIEGESDWFSAIGSMETNLLDLSVSYMNAKTMLAYELMLPHNQIVNYIHMQERINSIEKKFSYRFEELKKIIVTGNDEEIKEKIEEFFSCLKKSIWLGPLECKSLVIEMVFQLLEFGDVAENQYVLENERGSFLFNLINQPSINQMHEEIIKMIDSWTAIKESKKQYHPIVYAMIKLVEHNYSKEISLKTIAATLEVTPKYAGQLFKQEMGCNFSDYLCSHRINRAKYLLTNTNMKTYDIAVGVGFSDTSYFANVFKKVVGVYPSKYRKE